MRLNKHHKEAIVRAILQDVPQIDYETQIDDFVAKALYKNAPKEIQTVWDCKKLRGWLRPTRNHEGDVYHMLGNSSIDGADLARLKELRTKRKEQFEQLLALERKLKASIESCRTRKQFVDRFPEFEKYAPIAEGTTDYALATANLIKELTASGWPAQRTA